MVKFSQSKKIICDNCTKLSQNPTTYKQDTLCYKPSSSICNILFRLGTYSKEYSIIQHLDFIASSEQFKCYKLEPAIYRYMLRKLACAG